MSQRSITALSLFLRGYSLFEISQAIGTSRRVCRKILQRTARIVLAMDDELRRLKKRLATMNDPMAIAAGIPQEERRRFLLTTLNRTTMPLYMAERLMSYGILSVAQLALLKRSELKRMLNEQQASALISWLESHGVHLSPED